jgi:hypothetical protein
VQLDLLGDYKSNVAMYPEFQAYFRKHKPPLLAAWGKNDPFFPPRGAEAFKRDIPGAEVRFYDTATLPSKPTARRSPLRFVIFFRAPDEKRQPREFASAQGGRGRNLAYRGRAFPAHDATTACGVRRQYRRQSPFNPLAGQRTPPKTCSFFQRVKHIGPLLD